jgi:hypothetical protein
MKITRRRFLKYAAATCAAAVAFEGFVREPGDVEFTEHALDRGGDRDGGTLRFAQLSDLHLTGVGPTHRAIAARIARLGADFLIITGDAVDGNHRLADLDEFLSLLPRTLAKYAILGNWEHWGHVNIAALRALYESHGGELLVNRTATFEHAGRRVAITGVDDPAGAPSIELALAGVEPSRDHIILAHTPLYRDYLADYNRLIRGDRSRVNPPIDFDSYGIRYVFSGHTHGGQVNLAGFTPFMPPGCGDYVKGWYGERAPRMYVCRGIGTSILPIRLGSRPEVAVFTW